MARVRGVTCPCRDPPGEQPGVRDEEPAGSQVHVPRHAACETSRITRGGRGRGHFNVYTVVQDATILASTSRSVVGEHNAPRET